jgi:transcriptional regulator with XRE-family HTH domain
MKERTQRDEIIKDRIAKALKQAMKKRNKLPEETAGLLHVEPGTLYKYLAGDMIPGGQVLWRACEHLGMVLDETGFRVSRRRRTQNASGVVDTPAQYELPFINESVAGNKIRVHVRRKENEYVQVQLRIKIAG